MSKAFTNENADSPEEELLPSYRASELAVTAKNYTTPAGLAMLRREYEELVEVERPALASKAAHATATSQQLDAQTFRRRLREIDWRAQYLRQRIDHAEVVDPAARKAVDQVFFGATVRYLDSVGQERTVSIVGVEEADAARGLVSFVSPLGKALLRAEVGEVVQLKKPESVEELEILEVSYRAIG